MKRNITLIFLLLLCVITASAGERPKVALVLGGGGAKGAAEVGVLKEIERVGMPVDYIVGTSIGSIIGGLYSLGYHADALDSLFNNQDWPDLFNDARVHGQGKLKEIHGKGLMKGRGVIQFLDTLIARRPEATSLKGYPDSIDFDDMPIPYRAVACDVNTGNAVVLGDGNLTMTMRSSMAIPGIFKPVTRDTLTMLDGGLVNNLPVDVARSLGADYVIAIDLTQNKHPDYKSKTIEENMPKAVKWLRTRPDFVNYNRNREEADIYINPTLDGYGVTSFKTKAIKDMIRLGEEAGKAKHDELVKLRDKVLNSK